MKRYVGVCFILLIGILMINNQWDTEEHHETFTVVSYAEKDQIYIQSDSEPFIIKGVNLNGYLPNDSNKQERISKAHYKEWFQQIVAMHANILQVPDLMPERFYEALHEFNQERAKPLYLIQGIGIDADWLSAGIDVFQESFQKQFRKHLFRTIDAVHGEVGYIKRIEVLEGYGEDVSPYVLAYNIGTNWDEALAVYTEIMHTVPLYEGEYLKSTQASTPLETFIATFMDEALVYEQTHYNTQRLLTTTSFMSQEMLTGNYSGHYVNHYINLETIVQTEKLKSGIFVSYEAYPFKPEFLNQLPEYVQAVDAEGNTNSYRAILEAIKSYHTLPVAISAYGVPSSRGVAYIDASRGFNAGGIDEVKQGEILGTLFEDIMAAGLSGGSVNNWYDTWHSTTWNTLDGKDTSQYTNWGNVQSANTAFGLISLDTSLQSKGFYPDGNLAEWQDIKPQIREKELQLSITQDEKYIYLLLQHPNIDLARENFYIGLDLTPNSGSPNYNHLTFNKPVDFVLELQAAEDAALKVHAYYDTHTFKSHLEELKQDPTEVFHQPDEDAFAPIRLGCRPKTYIDTQLVEGLDYETGRLIQGQDFYVTSEGIEVRIPWALLNFKDPSRRQIHDDYYKEFAIFGIPISNVQIEIIHESKDQPIYQTQPVAYKLKAWTKAKYKERLKPAYHQLKAIYSQY